MKKFLYVYVDLCCGEIIDDYFTVFRNKLINDNDFINLYELEGIEYDLLVFDLERGVRIQ